MQQTLTALNRYPDPGYSQLRQALGQYHSIDPDWVLPGNGAAELLTWAARDLCHRSSQPQSCRRALPVGVLAPAFGDYQRAIAAFGGRSQTIPLLSSTGAVDLEALPRLAQAADRVGGYLINNPHNPTGAIFAIEALLPLLETDKPVMVDEAFMDFLPPTQQPSLIPWVQRFPNLVVLRSLTKFYSLPGIRIGYAVGHPDRLQRWQQWRDPWPVNMLAEVATLAALGDVDFQTLTWQWLPAARQALFDGLNTIPGLHPLAGAANFLLVYSDYPVPELQEQLLKQHHILIRDCLSFPELGDCYFRAAVRTTSDNRSLVNALKRVAQEKTVISGNGIRA